jgi:hypothetical protein
LQNYKLDSELKSHESAPVPDLQPSIEPIDLICPLTETPEIDDNVVEISHQVQNKSHESASLTGTEASFSHPLDTLVMNPGKEKGYWDLSTQTTYQLKRLKCE